MDVPKVPPTGQYVIYALIDSTDSPRQIKESLFRVAPCQRNTRKGRPISKGVGITVGG
jgi:hypothetical protein